MIKRLTLFIDSWYNVYMNIEINHFPVECIKENGIMYADFLQFYCAIRDNFLVRDLSPVRKKIGEQFFIVKKGTEIKGCTKNNRRLYYISGKGISKYLSFSRLITEKTVADTILKLNSIGFNCVVYKDSKELNFVSDLEYVLTALGVKIRRQVNFELSYGDVSVDIVLNGKVIVEYDENKHYSYNKEKERLREKELKERGFLFLRVYDEKPNPENIGFVIKFLIDNNIIIVKRGVYED